MVIGVGSMVVDNSDELELPDLRRSMRGTISGCSMNQGRFQLLRAAMPNAEASELPVLSTNMSPTEKEATVELYHLLLHLTKGPALDRVLNSGEYEGLESWRSLTQRYGPSLKARSAGNLLEITNWDFSGDVANKVEGFERAIKTYDNKSKEHISDHLRIGIVLN